MTRPAMVEKGQLLKLQRQRCQQRREKWERLHMPKWPEEGMFKNRLQSLQSERLMSPLKEMHAHKPHQEC